MYGFNYLLPALVFKLQIFVSHEIGLLDVGYTVYNGQSIGTVESAAGYNTTVNATMVHMDDFFTLYGDKSYYGITPRGLMVTDDGEYVKIEASGLFAATDKVKALLAKEPNVNATEWGEMYSGMKAQQTSFLMP